MKRIFGWALAALTVASSGGAQALPAVFTPQKSPTGEFYGARLLSSTASTLAAMAEEALKALLTELPEAASIKVTYAQNTADLTIDPNKAGDPAIVDRALGAMFFTLQSVGFTEVRLSGAALTGQAFTRGAQAMTYSVSAVFAGDRPRDGFVLLEQELIPVGAFFARLDSQDKGLQGLFKGLMTDGRPEVRLQLVTQIAALKLKEAEAVLVSRLEDTDARVRKAAVAGLAKSPSAAAQKGLTTLVDTETDNGTRLDAVRILVAAGRKEFARYLLLDKLTSADLAEVKKAARELAATKDTRFTSGLTGLLSHNDASIRELGLQLLGEQAQWGPLAATLAKDDVPAATREAAAKLVASKAEGADRVTALNYLVSKGTPPAAIEAAAMIEAGPVTGTADGLRVALTRDDRAIVKAAAKAATAIKDAATLEALGAAVRSAADPAEKTALEGAAIAIIAAQPVTQALTIATTKDDTVRELATRALVTFAADAKPNPNVVDALRGSLKDSQPAIRRASAEALAKIADDAIATDLLKLKADPDPLIRAAVIDALTRTKVSGADATIVAALDDNESAVKTAALVGVKTRKIEAGLDKARWLVSHRQPEVRRAAMAALVAVGKPASPQLFDIYSKAMMDDDEIFRMHTLDGLKAYPAGDARVATAIGTPLIDERAPKSLQLKALSILVGIGGVDVVEHVVRGLFIEDMEVKLATLTALEQLKSEKSVRPLQEFMMRVQDPTARARAEKLLEIL